MKYKNILVTGAAGFIGSNFVRYILRKYDWVNLFSLDKLTYAGNIENLKSFTGQENHHFIRGDICNSELVYGILNEKHIDCIVHFAAESHVDRSITSPSCFIETNVNGTFSLLHSAKRKWLDENNWSSNECRFHHISTDEVYGSLELNDNAFTEKTPYAPNSPYSASKASSDHLVRAYFHTYGLPVSTSNCSNNYGPYQHLEKLIPTVIYSCLNHIPIPVYGNGNNIRDWLFVDDHCRAIDKILSDGKCGEVYNIGGKTEISNIELVKKICTIFDQLKPAKKKYSELIKFITDRAGHDFRYAIDNTKIQTELQWKPEITLEQGLIKTINFYLDSK